MIKQPISSIKHIKLSQWVEYQNRYGQALDDRFAELMKLPQSKEREDLLLIYNVDYHQQNYAFYTGTSLDIVRSLKVYDICEMQGRAFIEMKKEELALDIKAVFEWKGEKWRIEPVFTKSGQLTKKQYDIVTDIALVFSDLQDGKHEALYELCAIYLRHIDEPYTADLLEARKALMKELPLNIALCVKIYIETSIKQLIKR